MSSTTDIGVAKGEMYSPHEICMKGRCRSRRILQRRTVVGPLQESINDRDSLISKKVSALVTFPITTHC